MTFLSAAIFDFVKFNVWPFLEGLYGNWPFSRLKLWDVGSQFCKNFFRFVITASKTTFLSAAIFEFLKSQFWSFLRVCMEISHFRGRNYGMSDDVIRTMLCFSSVLVHGLSFYRRGFLNFAKKIFWIFRNFSKCTSWGSSLRRFSVIL